MTRTCTIRCKRCPGTFTAPNRLHKHCPRCREIRKAERIEQRKSYKPDRDKPVVPPRPRVRKKPILAPDFVLAFPEMRAEFQRAIASDIHVEPTDHANVFMPKRSA